MYTIVDVLLGSFIGMTFGGMIAYICMRNLITHILSDINTAKNQKKRDPADFWKGEDYEEEEDDRNF